MGCCCKLTLLIAALLAAFVGYKTYFVLYDVPPIPDLPQDQWWGPGEPPKTLDTSIKKFVVEFKPEMIDDLKARLNKTRYYSEPLEGVGFEYGFNNYFLLEVLDFWLHEYNFEERAKYLNKFSQFKTNIQGLDIHFILAKPNKIRGGLKFVPLLLLHGWPGSVVEFYKMIPFLTKLRDNKDYVFELIIPSLPGYGFSKGAAKPGLGAAQVAVVMKNLMDRLGYKEYIVQGGDWGSIIGSHMAIMYPDDVYAYHTNMPVSQTPSSTISLLLGSLYPPMIIEKEHESKVYPLTKIFSGLIEETGYFHLQSTKPDTIGVALKDSPIGLAAYIMEKFSTWTNREWKSLHDGGLKNKYKMAELIDNIMVYWVSNSITTSMRLYAETMNKAQMSLGLDKIPISVPTAVTRCANELVFMTKCQLKGKFLNIVDWVDHPNCGHFAAFEEPELIANDLWDAVPKFDKFHEENKKEKTEL